MPGATSGLRRGALLNCDFFGAQDVLHLGFAKSRGVVFKAQVQFLFVHMKPAKAVGVGKFAEAANLLHAEWGGQFVSDFDERHGGKGITGA